MSLKIHIHFSGGAELLFDRIKKREVELPDLKKYFPETKNDCWTIRELLVWIKENLLRERLELFLQKLSLRVSSYLRPNKLPTSTTSSLLYTYQQGESVRPGILVLINDADWELCGELDYRVQPGDTVMFISTLHGG